MSLEIVTLFRLFLLSTAALAALAKANSLALRLYFAAELLATIAIEATRLWYGFGTHTYIAVWCICQAFVCAAFASIAGKNWSAYIVALVVSLGFGIAVVSSAQANTYGLVMALIRLTLGLTLAFKIPRTVEAALAAMWILRAGVSFGAALHGDLAAWRVIGDVAPCMLVVATFFWIAMFGGRYDTRKTHAVARAR